MKVYVIVGRKKAGKTTKALDIVRRIGAPVLVYDTQGQWTNAAPPTMDKFLDMVQAARGRVVVFEEAGIFFANTGRSERLVYILTSSRHHRNVTLFLFHSLRQVPLYVLDLADRFVLFKTNDTPRKVLDKFRGMDHVLDAWESVNADPDPHAFRTFEV